MTVTLQFNKASIQIKREGHKTSIQINQITVQKSILPNGQWKLLLPEFGDITTICRPNIQDKIVAINEALGLFFYTIKHHGMGVVKELNSLGWNTGN